MARTLLPARDTRGPAALKCSAMKTIVISLSLLLLLLACGKLPEDPNVPRKPVLPGMASPAAPLHKGDGAELFGSRAAGAQRHSVVRSM
jgi:hypothetical protein